MCVRVSVCVWHHLLGQKSLLGYQCHKLLEYADPVARRKRAKTARKREREEGGSKGEGRGGATTNEALNLTAQLFACQAFIKFTVLLDQQLGVNYGLSLGQWACMPRGVPRQAGRGVLLKSDYVVYRLLPAAAQLTDSFPLSPPPACLPYLNSCQVQQILFQVHNFVFGNCISHLFSPESVGGRVGSRGRYLATLLKRS